MTPVKKSQATDGVRWKPPTVAYCYVARQNKVRSTDTLPRRIGLWGGCSTAITDQLESCTERTWGYSLDLVNFVTGTTTPLVGYNLTRSLGNVLPLGTF
jgi:hypothetical protein